MHPILASWRRLAVYLAIWIPAGALIALVARGPNAIPLADLATVLAPACLAYAFICLSPWYICRARPMRPANVPGLALTFTAAAAVAALLLVAAAQAAAWAWDKPAPPFLALFGLGVLLYLLAVGLHYAGLAIEASRQAEVRAVEARTLAREAELQALRIQINPHFLFNSLHSISALAAADGLRAREMCIKLGDFLRASLRLGPRQTISLRDELALAQSYLQVEQVRFGSRLKIEAAIDAACENCEIPALLLQPLAENAVKHGIANMLEGGSVRLAAELRGPSVAITIENDFDPDMIPKRDLGVGLATVRRRLEISYGSEALFEAGPSGRVYRVSLRFPCESSMASVSRA